MSRRYAHVVERERRRAKQSLKAASLLLREALYEDAVSKAYYACFHMARAVLLNKEIVPRSHRSVISLFGLHFVKCGIVSGALGRVLAQEFEDRLTSDYDVETDIEEVVARQRFIDAEDFIRHMGRWLDQEQPRRRLRAKGRS